MNDVLPSGAPNINKQENTSGPGQQQSGIPTPGGGPNNSNLSITNGPFAGASLGAPGVGPRGSSGSGGQPQALDRLNRRVSGYRARQENQLPKYSNTMNTINNQHSRETILLRQKYLENTKNKKVIHVYKVVKLGQVQYILTLCKHSI